MQPGLVPALLVWLLAFVSNALAAGPAPAIFFDNPALSGALLSPSARFLAVRATGKSGHERLAVLDLGSNVVTVVAEASNADIGNFEWVNDERLLYDLANQQAGTRVGPGLYAVNRDGGGYRQLANRSGALIQSPSSRKLLPWHTAMLGQAGAQDSAVAHVLSYKYDNRNELAYIDLLRLDTATGRFTRVDHPGKTMQWLLDRKGEARLVVTVEGRTQAVFYRDPASGQWRKLVEFDAWQGARNAFEPLAFGPDGTLYVVSNQGADKSALYAFDLAAGRVREPALQASADFDFSGELIIGANKLLGVRHLASATATVWFDDKMKQVQQAVDRLLANSMNLISVGARAETPWVLVMSYSDRQPSRYFLFNTDTGVLNKVGDTMPAVDPAAMASQKLVHYKARDGLDIPAWLTLPPGRDARMLPLVVLVHGGPYQRGSAWGWHPDSQFLASRGYAVLEPEYRGSTGFGERHYRAGWKQWGLAMQDDLADGATWAIAQGIVDPKRICIAGASYGGYATLMGLVNDPALYKCGIDWVGVTDIKLLYAGHWRFSSDISNNWKQYGMPALVGDLVKDAGQLKATSPLEQAARITQPLLLAYGGADRRVPLYHGEKFYAEVTRTNAHVEWLVYDEEGHGWTQPANRIDFWNRVEKFLERNIGTPGEKAD
ncbi:MAG: prolyl oligopeptidase family serine peptidase [Telluria sp.]